MNLDRLTEFCVIARIGSYEGASRELHIPPNVLSARLHSFEKSLNVRLVITDRKRLHLTDSGRLLMQNSEELMENYQKMKESFSHIQGRVYRSLHLQLCAQTLTNELGPWMDLYCRKYPRLFLDLYDENTCTIRDGLRTGLVDIAFAIGKETDFLDIPGRIVLTSYPEMKVFVPTDHALAGRRTVSFRELSGETFILYPNMIETHTRDLQLSMLEQAGIEYTVYEEQCSPHFFELLVPIGKGIRLWNWNEQMAPNTELLQISDKGYETYMYLLYNPQNPNPTVRSFIEGFFAFKEARK